MLCQFSLPIPWMKKADVSNETIKKIFFHAISTSNCTTTLDYYLKKKKTQINIYTREVSIISLKSLKFVHI